MPPLATTAWVAWRGSGSRLTSWPKRTRRRSTESGLRAGAQRHARLALLSVRTTIAPLPRPPETSMIAVIDQRQRDSWDSDWQLVALLMERAEVPATSDRGFSGFPHVSAEPTRA